MWYISKTEKAGDTMDFTNLPPDSKAFLAPMAGVADRAFREICRDFGAAYTVTEMVSAKGLVKIGRAHV